MFDYCSFIVVKPEDVPLLEQIQIFDDWKFKFCTDPSLRFWFHQSGYTNITSPHFIDKNSQNGIPGQLLIVRATETTANNLVQLICSSYDLIEGNPSQRVGMGMAFKLPDDESERESIFRNVFQTTGFFESFFYKADIPVAIHLACKAWGCNSIMYSIHKLAQSFAMESITWWSTHPKYGQIFERQSSLLADHVRSSVAINLAFSAIEELQLQIKSDSTNHRFLNKEIGEWNPKVLKCLAERLELAGIAPHQKFTWFQRGEKNAIESSLKPKFGAPVHEFSSEIVRDIELTLPEALHYCSYIRNYMTAHRFSQVTPSLGPYEVHNIQSLARRLILLKCGLWNVFVEDLRPNSTKQ